MATLFDKIETYLRALETLGLKSDAFSAMLYPLVESCLNSDVLVAWHRSFTVEIGEEDSLKNRLDKLISFLRREVENEERLRLASSGFESSSGKSSKKEVNGSSSAPVATASTLSALTDSHVVKVKDACVFCKSSHKSSDCKEALNLSIEARRKIVMSAGLCFVCFTHSHWAIQCRKIISCDICSRRHFAVMCPGEENKRQNRYRKKNHDKKAESSMSNVASRNVLLQTLVVWLKGDKDNCKVRAIIDTGSERSYITKSIAERMNYKSIGEEKIIHGLFGGTTSEISHQLYEVQLINSDSSYVSNIQVLDQETICSEILPVPLGEWDKELASLAIEVKDRERGPIEVLIGADVAGKILTGKKADLKCGLTTVETYFGWTLLGKVNEEKRKSMASMVITSLVSAERSLADLWRLDVLGLADPSEKKSKQEVEEATRHHFLDTLVRRSDGRYEVSLPWVEGHPPLPSNYNLACKRLQHLRSKLEKDKLTEAYNEVFEDWFKDGIIEEVPVEELNNPAHYLPHRHVVKINSLTTKIRPVFDAGARERGSQSLNACLDTGRNTIELIPNILHRFRLEEVGISSDIAKAFLQISLNKRDRDSLRFLWFDKDGGRD